MVRPENPCMWGGIDGVECEVRGTRFGSCGGKFVGEVIAFKARVAADFEESGGGVLSCSL